MQPNATELKVSPLLPTPTRPTRATTRAGCPPRTSGRSAKRGHGGLISSLNRRSKRGQPRPNGSKESTLPPSLPCAGGNLASPPVPPFQRRLEFQALMRVKPPPASTRGMIGNGRKLKFCHSYALLSGSPSFPCRREPRIPVPCPRHSSEGWNPGEVEGGAPSVSTRGMSGNDWK